MKCSRCGAALPPEGTMCHSCGSILRANEGQGLELGTIIAGKYEVIEQIGAGGTGRVYRAVQRPLDVEVCVKTLHHGASLDPQFPARFEREAKTTSQLRHPNIVSVMDFGTHLDGSMYLVMEYIRGTSLAELAGKGKYVSAERAVRILSQVCDALSSAHNLGVIHRDLKPANIMVMDLLDNRDYVKVLDFGSALITEGNEEERLTQIGTVIGTPAYMAPEYILGRGVDPRVDIYAVGVLLYLLLCGYPPFSGTSQSVFAQHVTVKPALPSTKNPEVTIPRAIEKVVMHALIKDPAHRYPTAAALKDAMERALRGEEEDFDLSEPEVGTQVGVELAPQERSVVVAVVRGVYGLTKEAVSLVKSEGRACGAWVRRRDESGVVPLIFGIEGDGTQACAAAVGCAQKLVALPMKRPITVGLYHAQASCRGQPRTEGFVFELFGGGPGVAANLAACAQPGRILVSGPVSRFVPPSLQLIPTEPPSRFKEPVFELADPAAQRTRGSRSPFVGREKERQALVELAVNALQGKIFLVLGPEGMGKSRLIDEVASQAAKVGTFWCVAPSAGDPEIGASHPTSLLAALGWNASGGSGSSAERHIIEYMLGRVAQDKGGLRGERRQLRLVAAALSGLRQRLRYGPIVVVLDDLHHADDLTWSLAHRLVNSASLLGVSVVLCLRDESQVPFSLPDGLRRIELPPLSERETLSLVRSGLGEEAPKARVSRIAGRAQGLPLLAEELIRAAKRGQEELIDALPDGPAKEAIDILVQHRVQSLSPRARRVIWSAAVLGVEPRQSDVIEVAGGDSHEIMAAFVELESQVLFERRSGRLRFSFPRVLEVVSRSIPPGEWSELHDAAATVIAQSDTSEHRLLELGDHLLQAERYEEAFDLLHRAGKLALDEGKNRRAAYCLELAIEAARQLGPERIKDLVLVYRDLGQVLIQLDYLDQAEEILREGFHRAREANAASVGSELLRLHGRTVLLAGDLDRGRREIETTLKFAERRGDFNVAAQACVDLADAAEQASDTERAVASLKRGLELIEGRNDPEAVTVRIQLYNRLGRLELESVNLSRAIALFAQALDLAESTQDLYQAAGLMGNLGGAYARQQDSAKALYFTERALRASEELGDQIGIARQSFNLALLRLSVGHTDQARALLKSSHEACCRSGWHEGLAMTRAAMTKLSRAE